MTGELLGSDGDMDKTKSDTSLALREISRPLEGVVQSGFVDQLDERETGAGPDGFLEPDDLRRILQSLDVQLFSHLDAWLKETELRLEKAAAPGIRVSGPGMRLSSRASSLPTPRYTTRSTTRTTGTRSTTTRNKPKSGTGFQLVRESLQESQQENRRSSPPSDSKPPGDPAPKESSQESQQEDRRGSPPSDSNGELVERKTEPKQAESGLDGENEAASVPVPQDRPKSFLRRQNAVRPRTWVSKLVNDPSFDVVFGVAILTNALFIGIQTDVFATQGPESNELLFYSFSLVYTLLFTAELILKLVAEGFFTFCWTSPHWLWNWLDVFIVLTSIVEASVATWMLVSHQLGSKTAESAAQASYGSMRLLRITRLVKVIRITRIIRFIRALRTMVHHLLSTMKALMWAIVLLALIIYSFAIVFTQATTMTRDLGDGSYEGLDFDKPLFVYWSTLPRSMFTLFKAITGGVSWHEVATPLGEVGALAVCIFVAYISFAQFAVLNVLTGVFCQSAIDSAAHDAELVAQSAMASKRMYMTQIENIFKDFDIDGSGSITIQEFAERLNDENVRAYFDSLELDTSDIWMLFRLLDADGGDELDVNEFVSGCLRLKGNAKGVDMAKLSSAQNMLSERFDEFVVRTDKTLSELRNPSRVLTC